MTTDAPALPPDVTHTRTPPSGAALDAVPTLTEMLDWPAAVSAPAVDALSDERLRAIVEPVLERLADALLRELRGELAAVLHAAARQAIERERAGRRVG